MLIYRFTLFSLLRRILAMQVNNLEGREVMIIGFGGVILLTLVVLSSIYVGHAITSVSSVPQPVHVLPAQPAVSVNVPAQSVPKVEVTATSAAPKIDVHVPTQTAPVVNFTPPPAQITVVEREKQPAPEKPAAPSISPKVDPKPVPAAVEHSEAKEEYTVDTLYVCAERYIEMQCRKAGLDPVAENAKWLKHWQSRITDSGLDEQELLNRSVVDNRDCFDVQKATPEKIVEACRLMLRYRDTKLQWLQALKDAMTRENLQKTIAFLNTGGK
jgi:hypothetical protein